MIPELFDGRSYADSPPSDIDPDRNGFPGGIASIAEYLDSSSHRPLVESSFANIIDLDYRVAYNNITKRFSTASGDEKDRDLIVLTLNSSVRGITVDDTELIFGAGLGVPEINVNGRVPTPCTSAAGTGARPRKSSA